MRYDLVPIICPRCKGEGKLFKSPTIISLLSCKCGHGGDAWHLGSFGACTYHNCKCKELELDYAIVGTEKLYPTQFEEFLKLQNNRDVEK